MPLDKSKFKYYSNYTGLWSFSETTNQKLFGTLHIEANKMWIELFFESCKEFPEIIETITGQASAIDSTGKEHAANIRANGLTFEQYCHLENGLWHYRYSVSCIYMYDGELKTDNLHSIQLRASILDDWAASIMRNAFHSEVFQDIPAEHHGIYYVMPMPYNLFKNKDVHVSIQFCSQYQIGGINQGVKQKSFLRISLNKPNSFESILGYAKEFQYLFYLLTNRIFPIDYMFCEYGNNIFFYKDNEQQACRYIEEHPNAEPFSTVEDFGIEEIKTIFSKWDAFYNNHLEAINTYYETQSNIYTPPTAQIKNYISVIDALTKTIVGKSEPIHPLNKKAKFLESLFAKYNIDSTERKCLTDWLVMQKAREIKPRLKQMIEFIGQYKPADLDANFVEKIVNTRNNQTHPKSNEEFCFHMDEYRKVSLQLSVIIRAYILMNIEVKDEIISKILRRYNPT
jgi:hypothetical protein